MPRRLPAVLLCSLTLGLAACGPDPDRVLEVLEVDSGVRVELLERGHGPSPQAGGYVQVRYRAFLDDGTALGDSPEDEAFLVRMTPGDSSAIEGLRAAVSLLSEGSRARVTVPASQAYGDVGKGAIPPGATLVYELTLAHVFERTASGLQLLVQEAGDGPRVEDGDQVVVEYRGWLLETGREFGSSRRQKRPEEFRLGEGKGLKGWEEALRRLSPGGRCLIAVPPELGYGPMGRLPAIPPGHDLLYELHLLGVRS